MRSKSLKVFASVALLPLVIAMVALMAASSSAQAVITVGPALGGTIFYPVGHTVDLGTHDTGVEGQSCRVQFVGSQNNESVWPGNYMNFTTGGTTVRLNDVEAGPGTTRTSSQIANVGSTVHIELVVGRSRADGGGHFSIQAGTVSFVDCETQPTTTSTPPTTTAPPTTTEPPPTTAPPTTAPPTATTSPPTATTTVPTQVGGAVQVAPPAQPAQAQPSFTG